MRSKAEIERVLNHMRTDCAGEPAHNAVYMEALEWVLGDDAHKQAYDEFIRHLEPPELTGSTTSELHRTTRELLLEHSLLRALARLR